MRNNRSLLKKYMRKRKCTIYKRQQLVVNPTQDTILEYMSKSWEDGKGSEAFYYRC